MFRSIEMTSQMNVPNAIQPKSPCCVVLRMLFAILSTESTICWLSGKEL